MRRVLLAMFLLSFVPATSARAITVGEGEFPDEVAVADVAGEVNALTIEAIENGVRITDASSDIREEAEPCVAESARAVVCTGALYWQVDLGGLDDELTLRGAVRHESLFISGGDGADRLDAGGAITPGARSQGFGLWGDGGNDAIVGSPGPDLVDGGPGADAIGAGAGRDSLDYSGRSEDLVIDLTGERPSGAKGEGDTLRAIEDVEAGGGDDLIIGTDAPNELEGGHGDDTLRGNEGDDELEGAQNADRLYGGGGDDELSGDVDDWENPVDLREYGGGGDRASGGAGNDHIEVGARSLARGGGGDDEVMAFRSKVFGGGGDDHLWSDLSVNACGAGRDRAGRYAERTSIAADCEQAEPLSQRRLVLNPPRSQGRGLVLSMVALFGSYEGTITVTTTDDRVLVTERPLAVQHKRRRVLRLRLRRPLRDRWVVIAVTDSSEGQTFSLPYSAEVTRGRKR